MRTLHRKLIITGTGRAGTTFLVQLLTELGLDTGFSPGNWGESYHEHCRAGLEHDLRDPAAPYVVKNPNLCDTLGTILEQGSVVIDHALVPIRPLQDAAQSRVRVGGSGKTPGGLTGTANEADQPHVLAERFHRLVHTLAAHRIPTTFLEFPRFAQDASYTFNALRPVLPRELDWAEFAAAFARTARPELIHQFNGARPADAGAPAREHAATRRLARSAQRRRRLAALTAVGATLGVAGWIRSGHGSEAGDPAELPNAATAPVVVLADAQSSGTGDESSMLDAVAGNGSGMYVDRAPKPASQLRRSRFPRMPAVHPRTVLRTAKLPQWL